jgi:hypothetical protein
MNELSRPDETRGGTIHLMRRTGFLIGQVLRDLEQHNRKGIEDPDICRKLTKLFNAMRAAPSNQGGFVKSRWNPAVDAMNDLYGTWNKLAGKDDHTADERKNKIAQINRRRERLFGRICNPAQEQIALELDSAFFMRIWDGFERIADEYGDVFPRLKRHITRERLKVKLEMVDDTPQFTIPLRTDANIPYITTRPPV